MVTTVVFKVPQKLLLISAHGSISFLVTLSSCVPWPLSSDAP